ncbi:hypothetical protein HYH02_008266 [Chlamydomonas schloesseri]|uniref:Guanylate cyclase domain-containing protein n=1 Tax=Chlamydomonas schloesseri TaxID=2026947 RepID=A0A835WGF4_9CHLO|nr:hypothetical protein HYH02_008266 [Chlamydomonas schloesseri]|eukprot:KAG2446701.1 hypothetical protein HYH02_008266 [Chlamydomonas schloesseri]
MSSVATSQQAPPRPLRVVAPKLALLDSLASRADVFSDTTGVPVSFDLLSFGAFSLRRQSLLLDRSPPNVTHGYDVMIVTPTAYGDAAQVPGKLLDISRLVSGDPSLLDILPAFRAATMYSGGVMAIPLVPAPFLLFYRLDIFQRDNLTVPQTWEQFADLAERYHNGPDGLVGNCNIPVGGTCRGESVFLRALLTSYIQTEGPSHGFLWDPETMQTLVTSEAGETALKMFRRLTAVGPTWSHSPECVQNDFNMGRCFMGVGHPSQFKSGSFGAPGLTRARGKMGIAPHPGTTRVLDRTTLKLVPCDRTRCPLAEEVVMEDGASRLLNRPILLQSTMVMLNGLSPLAFQFYAFQLFALLASASVVGTGRGNGLLLEPNELLPMRLSDVSPDQLKYWVAKGYDPGDAERFLAVYRTTAIKEHIMPEVKIRMASNVTSALNTAAALYNSPATNATALPAILGRLEAALNGIVAAEGGQDAFAQQYRRSLNWVPKTGTGGAASVSPAPDSQHGASSAEVTVALAVAIPCVAADTKCLTLVVTDIYESTALWEKLPASVMDAAVSTHHAVIRQALLVHGGVESATEGDSFIISLKAPVAAAAFCLDVQQP